MSKNTHPANRALKELQAFREAEREPIRRLVASRWPDSAVTAGVRARIRRYWWSVLSGLLQSGTVSW